MNGKIDGSKPFGSGVISYPTPHLNEATPAPGMSAGISWIGLWGSGDRRRALHRDSKRGAEAQAAPKDATERIALGGSNVLGATGLSRQALRDYIRSRGLFGRDSSLDPAEQAAVQEALRAGLSLPLRNINLVVKNRKYGHEPAPASRIAAIRDFAEAAVRGAGTVTRAEWARAHMAELSPAQRSEVLAVVCLLRDSFGLLRFA